MVRQGFDGGVDVVMKWFSPKRHLELEAHARFNRNGEIRGLHRSVVIRKSIGTPTESGSAFDSTGATLTDSFF
jgi:hypothetical protein